MSDVSDWLPRLTVILVTCAVIVACVVLHYEALAWLTKLLRQSQLRPRSRILFLIFALLLVHVLEIWIFGVAYLALVENPQFGALVAPYPIALFDSVYFSAVCFTTLGMGDIVPVGPIRFMVGSQSLCGFVLIAWSGSFTFVEMQRFWKE